MNRVEVLYLLFCTQAIRTAFGKLEEGCSLEDAEAVCEPDVLRQIFRWKVGYLYPFVLELVILSGSIFLVV